MVNPHLNSDALKFAGRPEFTIYILYNSGETTLNTMHFMYIDIYKMDMMGGQPTPEF